MPLPVGEYAQSALGRERLFEYGSHTFGTPVVLLRLNYACELRYGVLLDANSVCLQALQHCSSPPLVLNLTGPESLSVRWIATEFAKRFGVEPRFHGEEATTALLSNSSRAIKMFGYPEVSPAEMIDWTAAWIGMGGATHGKPTHFETRDGRF